MLLANQTRYAGWFISPFVCWVGLSMFELIAYTMNCHVHTHRNKLNQGRKHQVLKTNTANNLVILNEWKRQRKNEKRKQGTRKRDMPSEIPSLVV